MLSRSLLVLLLAAGPAAAQSAFDCGTEQAAHRFSRVLADPARVPRVAPLVPAAAGAPDGAATVTPADIMPLQDDAGLLLTDFSDLALLDLMADGANALMASHGDSFDFVGFWLNFEPHHTIGLAFYMPVVNDVTGIGNPFQDYGLPVLSDQHAALGLGGTALQGMVMTFNVNAAHWQPGTGPGADFTRLALQHEVEHRFACYLLPLPGGRPLQGDFAGCGNGSHWNWRVDGQGGCQGISEWVGSAPAVGVQISNLSYNTDIPGGTYSYTDLYLMGMVDAAEMDAGNSELRYMDGSDCFSDHFGAITPFGSADLVAVHGPREPSAATSQKAFRMGWLMIHQPGDPPDAAELQKAADILNQSSADFSYGTLSRGTLDHTPPANAFSDLGQGLAGSQGTPVLSGLGSMEAGTTVTLSLGSAKKNTTSTLIVGLALLGASFKGGVMVPQPDLLVPGLPTGSGGAIELGAPWPPGLPPGLSTWYQHWIDDPSGPAGFAASNGLVGTTP